MLISSLFSSNRLLLRKKFGLKETLIFILVEIFIFTAVFKIILSWAKDADTLTLLPLFIVIIIAVFFIVLHYRKLEITPQTLNITRWGKHKKPEMIINKADITDIEINSGFNTKSHFQIFREPYYARLYFILDTGKTVDMYKISKYNAWGFKNALTQLGYPPIKEILRGKPLTKYKGIKK